METKKISGVEVHCAFDDEMDVVDLVPNPRNPNRHDDRQIALLAKIIRSQGWRNPIVISERSGFIVAGHGRMEAARVLNVEKVPVDHQAFGSEAEEYAHLIADNRIAELAEADRGELGELIKELEGKIDLDLTGFDAPGLEELLGELEPDKEELDAEPQIDKANELQAKWKTALGQVWELGDHRLLCGDCRDHKDVALVMNGEKINLAITSPPYASQRKYDESSGFKPVPPDEYVDWFEPIATNIGGNLADDGSWFINIKEHCDEGQRSLYVKDLTVAHVRDWGWLFVDEFIWTHSGTPKAVNQRFKNGWEPIFQFAKNRHKFKPDNVRTESDNVPAGDGRNVADYQGKGDIFDTGVTVGDGMAYPSNVLSLGKNRDALGHSAAFPVSLPTFFVKAFTDESDTVLDPFLGSGSTLIACENLNRACRGIEISPAYVAVIIERWADATGKTPKLTNGA